MPRTPNPDSIQSRVKHAIFVENMEPDEAASLFGISNAHVNRILWEAENAERKRAYEREYRRKRYANDDTFRQQCLKKTRRGKIRRQALEESVS